MLIKVSQSVSHFLLTKLKIFFEISTFDENKNNFKRTIKDGKYDSTLKPIQFTKTSLKVVLDLC